MKILHVCFTSGRRTRLAAWRGIRSAGNSHVQARFFFHSLSFSGFKSAVVICKFHLCQVFQYAFR